ncbi:hypothetical protein J3459_011114 [Metarhizium acridum]|nr:hypothetical protein J3459_011114 [Metarhizium acridum]
MTDRVSQHPKCKHAFLAVNMSKQSKQQFETKRLWEINDAILNENYAYQRTTNGLHYTLMTSRSDLPVAFFDFERKQAMEAREKA